METIDVGGEWWLPERPERRVAGWLSYDPDKGLQLRLIGRLRDYHEDRTGNYSEFSATPRSTSSRWSRAIAPATPT
jgi:hypothetical protein